VNVRVTQVRRRSNEAKAKRRLTRSPKKSTGRGNRRRLQKYECGTGRKGGEFNLKLGESEKDCSEGKKKKGRKTNIIRTEISGN